MASIGPYEGPMNIIRHLLEDASMIPASFLITKYPSLVDNLRTAVSFILAPSQQNKVLEESLLLSHLEASLSAGDDRKSPQYFPPVVGGNYI